MGRPKELTEEDRAELLAKGYRPIEIWVPNVESREFWKQLEAEGQAIRDSDRRCHMNEVLQAFIDDVWDDFK